MSLVVPKSNFDYLTHRKFFHGHSICLTKRLIEFMINSTTPPELRPKFEILSAGEWKIS
jgi:hypothetical protein